MNRTNDPHNYASDSQILLLLMYEITEKYQSQIIVKRYLLLILVITLFVLQRSVS